MSSNVLRMVLSTPAGHSADGKPVFLRDIWPSKDEIQVSPVSTLTVMATRMVLVSLSLSLFCSPQFIFLHYWSSFIASPITILSCRTLIFPTPVKPNLPSQTVTIFSSPRTPTLNFPLLTLTSATPNNFSPIYSCSIYI